MRRSARSTFFIAAAVAALAACGKSAPVEHGGNQPSPDDTPGIVDDTLHIALGAERSTGGGRLAIRFLERVSDDRCPANAVCIWAGDARVRLAVRSGTFSTETVIGMNLEPKAILAGGYRITVAELSPYPGLYDEENPPAPVVVVRIVRQ
jgi:hypothetical protein